MRISLLNYKLLEDRHCSFFHLYILLSSKIPVMTGTQLIFNK